MTKPTHPWRLTMSPEDTRAKYEATQRQNAHQRDINARWQAIKAATHRVRHRGDWKQS